MPFQNLCGLFVAVSCDQQRRHHFPVELDFFHTCLNTCLLSVLPTLSELYPPLTSISSFSSPFLKYESDELEKSVYQDYDSDSDVPEELKQDYVDEQTGDAPLKRSVPCPALSVCLKSPNSP